MFAKIDNFVSDYEELKEFLLSNMKVTYQIGVEDQLRKVFLLSCASNHEKIIQDIIKTFIDAHSDDECVLCFATNKAINRQYHTYFTWDANNINNFLGLFGSEFKMRVTEKISKIPKMQSNIKAFLTLGNERNMMVHEDYLSYQLEKTLDEIKVLNDDAMLFISFLQERFLTPALDD